MSFRIFKQALIENFQKQDAQLFTVEVDKDEMWNYYLDSFPAGTNEFFRQRREYDCSCCRSFIKNIGNTVFLKNGEVKTIWDFKVNDNTFQTVANAMNEYVASKKINGIYLSQFKKIGTDVNYELYDGNTLTWEHFFLKLPDRFINKSSRSLGDVLGSFNTSRGVFTRSLEEITEESLLVVLELISSNNLYKGEEWKTQLEEFLRLKKEYTLLDDIQREFYTWETTSTTNEVLLGMRGHSIGTLLSDISEGMELDLAVKKYEEIVAPHNYKRPKAIVSERMKEDARKTAEELGIKDSLKRRFANIEDIKASNILFLNRDIAKISDDPFDQIETSVDAKKFSRVQEIEIDKFITDVLPTTKEIEVLLENKHAPNMVSLIAPEVTESKNIFKWNNNFSWAYSGNITDSAMKERVKAHGGKTEGVLRFSIQWNDLDTWNQDDLDAHCVEPTSNRIHFPKKARIQPSSGMLDVDIINPTRNVPAVENIIYTDMSKMKKGTYKFLVHQYTNRGGKDGFRAEIEFEGKIYNFDYRKPIKTGEYVEVAYVTFDGNGFTLEEKLSSAESTREIWNLKSNQFVPVSTMMYSPNHWDERGIGHKHYFFMLKDCINKEQPNSFYNEFLIQELNKHRKVFEILGSKLSVVDADNQLSGLGFSSTKRNEVIVKTKGSTERVFKIKF